MSVNLVAMVSCQNLYRSLNMAVCCVPISSELSETDKHGNIKVDLTKASLDKISQKFSYELNY